jgi:hypothetical protein
VGLALDVKLPLFWYRVGAYVNVFVIDGYFFGKAGMGDQNNVGVFDLLNLFTCKTDFLVVLIKYVMFVQLPVIVQVNAYLELVPILQFFDSGECMIGQDAVIHEQVATFFKVLNLQVISDKYINAFHEHQGHDTPVIAGA